MDQLVFRRNAQLLRSNEHFPTFEALPEQKLLSLGQSAQATRLLYVYNPTDQRRREIIRVLVDSYRVHVTSNNQSVDACQVDPKWSDSRSNTMDMDQYEVSSTIELTDWWCYILVTDWNRCRTLFDQRIHYPFEYNWAQLSAVDPGILSYQSKATEYLRVSWLMKEREFQRGNAAGPMRLINNLCCVRCSTLV